MKANGRTPRGFSLVELLVVITIIGLIIGIALPSFNNARRAAKNVATEASIKDLTTGLESYQQERSLGGAYPPSQSDATDPSANVAGEVVNPLGNSDSQTVAMTGASLLVYAMVGADNQNTAGFQPLGDDATWAASFGGPNSDGLYDPFRNPPAPRASRAFVGANQINTISPIGELKNFDRTPLLDSQRSVYDAAAGAQKVFTDAFGGPILYYKARRGARAMIYNPGNWPGIYDYRDNQLLMQYNNSPHPMRVVNYESSLAQNNNADFGRVEGSFDEMILDKKGSIYADPTDDTSTVLKGVPVRRDSFLLISPGSDRMFGTNDDLIN